MSFLVTLSQVFVIIFVSITQEQQVTDKSMTVLTKAMNYLFSPELFLVLTIKQA